jgi:DNA-binding transcriptional regulator YhcF (GntR family)
MTIDKQIEPDGTGDRGAASPIVFRLDPASGVPTYLQLVQQVEHALRLGYLSRGDRLPTVKEVVGSLAINPNTVLKAYRELEHRGLADGRPGQGTFIRDTPATAGLAELTALRKTLLTWLRSADAAGLDEAGMVALFTTALRDFRGAVPPAPPERRGRDRHGEAPPRGTRHGGRGQAGDSEGVA